MERQIKMKVSIVLPVYNGERYLKKALHSIIRQTFTDFELIIVNDASTDHSLEIAEKYAAKDPRIKVYTNEKNSKLPQSLNNGFARASGELFTWTSDDNILHPNFLKRMVETLDEHPDVDLVYGMQQYIDENGKPYAVRDYPKDLDDIYYKDTVAACFMYRRKVHEELGGYDTSKFLVEDYDFWLRAYEKFKFYFLPEILYSYRMHKGSLTGQRRVEIKKRAIALREDILARTEDPKIRAKLSAGLAEDYMFISDIYIRKVKKAGDKDMFRSQIKRRLRMIASECLTDKDTFR